MSLMELCGDIPLSFTKRVRYVGYGLRQLAGSVPGPLAKRVAIDLKEPEVRRKISECATPLRVYTSVITQQAIARFSPRNGLVVDIGCGHGGHSRFFRKEGSPLGYLGIDLEAMPQWFSPRDRADFEGFVQSSATRLGLASQSAVFTFSSSTLEHVDDIRAAMGELSRIMQPGAYGLHIVPGVWSLFLYLFHGYRRFSTRLLRTLCRQADLEIVELWALGGMPSFLLHAFWIAGFEVCCRVGSRMRSGLMGRFYSYLLRQALVMDRWFPFCASGYAVLVRKPQPAPAA